MGVRLVRCEYPPSHVPLADQCLRRYNFLLYVPYQLERLIQYSLLLCIDSFLVRPARKA